MPEVTDDNKSQIPYIKYDIKELLDRLEYKIDVINSKIDEHSQRISMIEGKVKIYALLFSSLTTSLAMIITFLLHLFVF